MQKEPTIKELLEDLGSYQVEGVRLSELATYKQLKKEIKQLRKENKRLKIRNENLEYIVDTLDFLKDKLLPEQLAKIKIIEPEQIREAVSKLPVAEFKCAKTNNPRVYGFYNCIVNGSCCKLFTIVGYNSQGWERENVLAFAETSPEQILKALNNV